MRANMPKRSVTFLRRLQRICIVFLMSATAVQAQQTLSLEDAVAHSLQNNLGIRIAQHQAEVAAIGNAWGAAGALPSLGVSATGGSAISDQSKNPTSFLQERIESESVNVAGQLNWVLFDGMGMFANKRALERIEEQAEGQVNLVIEQTIAATIMAYNSVLVQTAVRDVLASSMEISRDRLKWIDARRASGASTMFDRLQFENALLSDSLAWMQQGINVRQAELSLNRLMGDATSSSWTFSSPLMAPENIEDIDQIKDGALSNAATIQNALISQEIARTGVQQAQARMSPTLLLNASQNDQASRFSAGDLSADGRTVNIAANISLNFNLFNGGATRRAIQQAKIQVAMAENQALDEYREVERLLADAWSRWTASSAAYAVSEQLTENCVRVLEIASERLATGAINSLDFREFQIQQMNAEQQQIQALNAWQMADVELLRLSGAWSQSPMLE
jgi:outer membrane protein TolC